MAEIVNYGKPRLDGLLLLLFGVQHTQIIYLCALMYVALKERMVPPRHSFDD